MTHTSIFSAKNSEWKASNTDFTIKIAQGRRDTNRTERVKREHAPSKQELKGTLFESPGRETLLGPLQGFGSAVVGGIAILLPPIQSLLPIPSIKSEASLGNSGRFNYPCQVLLPLLIRELFLPGFTSLQRSLVRCPLDWLVDMCNNPFTTCLKCRRQRTASATISPLLNPQETPPNLLTIS